MREFRFFCVICGSALQATPERAGSITECPRCLSVVPVPGYPATPGERIELAGIFPPGILDIEIKFVCEHCARKLRIDARWHGQVVNCPVCGALTKIPECYSCAPPPAQWEGQAPTPSIARLSREELSFLSASADNPGQERTSAGHSNETG